jgi:two-component sensor histidine kinase
MAFHELATNAAKYGALSNESGRIAVGWSIEPDAPAAACFLLSWVERDGPPVNEPDSIGFGSRVTVEMVEASLGGAVSVEFAASGLAWRLTCPAAQVLA